MRKATLLFVLGLISQFAIAQKHEIGGFFGVPNIIGDLGRTNYIQPLPPNLNPDELSITAGLLYRFNLNPRHSLRLNLAYNDIYFRDNHAKEDYRVERQLRDRNTIMEASLMFEYNFFEINDIQEFAHSPYIFGGGGAFMYKQRKYEIVHSLNRDSNGNPILPGSPTDFRTEVEKKESNKMDWTLLFGVGYKVKFNYNWIIFAEVGFRPTFTDELDYNYAKFSDFTYRVEDPLLFSSPYQSVMFNRNLDEITKRRTGNIKTNDWYVNTVIGLAYTFGRPPCWCD